MKINLENLALQLTVLMATLTIAQSAIADELVACSQIDQQKAAHLRPQALRK